LEFDVCAENYFRMYPDLSSSGREGGREGGRERREGGREGGKDISLMSGGVGV